MRDLFPGLDPSLVNHYLAAFQVRGVVATAFGAPGPVRIFTTVDASLKRAIGREAVAFWTGEAEASALVAAVNAALRGEGRICLHGAWSVSLAEAEALIRNVAGSMSCPVTEHQTMIRRTGAALARIDRLIAEMQADGRLGDFNRAFRASRLSGSGSGLSYRRLVHGLRQRLISEMAAKVLARNGFRSARRDPPLSQM